MSNPASYNNFKTKHDLALVLFDGVISRALKTPNDCYQKKKPDFSGKFRMFIRASLTSYIKHPHATIFTAGNLAVPDLMCLQIGKINLLLRL